MISTEVDAKKNTISGEDAWKFLSEAEKVVVANGRKILHFTPDAESKEELLGKALGRTGNLRAPAIKIRSTVYIGFNEEMYGSLDKL